MLAFGQDGQSIGVSPARKDGVDAGRPGMWTMNRVHAMKSKPLGILAALAIAAALLYLVFWDWRLAPEQELTVLAGSELKDLEPWLGKIESGTGLRLRMSYTGTLDGAERLMNGEPADLAWFSHAKYLQILQGPEKKLPQEKIMLSPVVLGVKESKARAWGWVDNPALTWRDIAAKAAAGDLRFGMTDPTASNTGFSALMGVVSALSTDPEGFSADPQELQGFFRGQALHSGSSGWLADAYVREQDRLDGLVNYESVLLQLNAGGTLREPLYLVYPKEGIVTADYPLMLMNPEKREAFDTLVAYLRSPELQRIIMDETQRRPVIPQVRPDERFPDRVLVELRFPGSREVVDRILFQYLDEQRVPSHAVFVLDVSGSMQGERIAELQRALLNLAGLDRSITGQFARFRGRERVTFIPFSSRPIEVRDFEVRSTEAAGPEMTAIRGYVNTLRVDGGTAIFSALRHAYEQVAGFHARAPERYYSIVLMSDGENNEGETLRQFLGFHADLPEPLSHVKTFPILFGEADVASMERVAEATGGRVFDAKKHPLGEIFKQIRGYQ